MIGPHTLIGLIGYAAAALAFFGLAVLALASRKHGGHRTLSVTVCGVTGLWAALAAGNLISGFALIRVSSAFEILHVVAWVALLASFLQAAIREFLRSVAGRVFGGLFAIFVVGWLVVVVGRPFGIATVFELHVAAMLVTVIGGLTLVEMILRNTPPDERWKIKFLCIGVGGIFVFTLFLSADSLLFSGVRLLLSESRGAIYALVAPLLALSIRRYAVWEPSVVISRRAAFYVTTLTTSGLYLIAMAAAAYYVRQVGGEWGDIFLAVFLFGAIVMLAVILASGTVRAYLKVIVAKNFFPYKYDYREEWLRFTNTVSSGDPSASLESRVVTAIANILDSPAGALWLREGSHFSVAATWNVTTSSTDAGDVASLARFVENKDWIIEIPSVAATPERYEGLVLPEAVRRIDDAWMIVPLISEGDMGGFVVLTQPRAPKSLDWEDYDLLGTVGRQAASYLAEQRAIRQLAEVNEFHRFHRRFAFVLHDIKNLASRFSLIASNVEKHGENPEFRADMVKTIRDATEHLNQMMARIGEDQLAEPGTKQIVRIVPLLKKIVAQTPPGKVALTLEINNEDAAVVGETDRLAAILRHLLQNALEAAGKGGQVQIGVNARESTAIIEFTDNGAGMDDAFVRNELFKPFRSTKERGFGIGAFQCREYAREIGGDLQVISSSGSGTTMRVVLPYSRAQETLDQVRTAV